MRDHHVSISHLNFLPPYNFILQNIGLFCSSIFNENYIVGRPFFSRKNSIFLHILERSEEYHITANNIQISKPTKN